MNMNNRNQQSVQDTLTKCKDANRVGRALYSVRMGERMMSLLMSLNSFQSSSRVSMSRNSGSNFGPPGMHRFKLLAVMNACHPKLHLTASATYVENFAWSSYKVCVVIIRSLHK